ncbi:sensor histidine kinase [Roseinatronobacter alkalisoli]|uniref:histidine kinase n=1 Tax=Roseinatronobacter alkalisoli TaxID=3028235 RepID=A0ABT5TA64_9RHOB|nr:hypothetical protein [Roseinatronobacter sp. HJB301]MDD7972013.1 hypothetical protein [Roseinatronobacter sp. HJB301]
MTKKSTFSVATFALLSAVLMVTSVLILDHNPHRTSAPIVILDHVHTVEFVIAETAEPLASQHDFTLSQDWRMNVSLDGRAPLGLVRGYYTIPFSQVNEPMGSQAILIPRVARTMDLVLNGELIYTESEQDAMKSWEWYTPRLVDLPDGLIRQGENLLNVTVTASFHSTAGLSKLFLGPTAMVETIGNRLNFLQKSLPLFANLATFVMAIPLLLIWLQGRRFTFHRHFSSYGFLAGAMVIFAFRSLHVHAGEVPIPIEIWVPLVSSSLAWAVAFFSIFLLRQSGLVWQLPERCIIVATVAGTAVLFLFPQSYFAENRTLFFYVPLTAVGVACITFICVKTIMRPERDLILLSLALLMIVPPTINDLAWLRGALPFETVLLLPVAMPTIMFAISVTVANSYARAWVRAHEANVELNRGIEAARKELHQQYEARIIAERRETIASERAQLIEDLHDGVGNRLSMLIATFRAQKLPGVKSLRDCLDDLRIVMTARDVHTVGEALVDMCHINRSAAEALGIDILLDCTPPVRALQMPPTQMLNILRIGQEALSNAVRHSGSREIKVQGLLSKAEEFILRISDIGAACPRTVARENPIGRGLDTMRSRAARLGGTLTITQGERGWTVECVIPVAHF